MLMVVEVEPAVAAVLAAVIRLHYLVFDHRKQDIATLVDTGLNLLMPKPWCKGSCSCSLRLLARNHKSVHKLVPLACQSGMVAASDPPGLLHMLPLVERLPPSAFYLCRAAHAWLSPTLQRSLVLISDCRRRRRRIWAQGGIVRKEVRDCHRAYRRKRRCRNLHACRAPLQNQVWRNSCAFSQHPDQDISCQILYTFRLPDMECFVG